MDNCDGKDDGDNQDECDHMVIMSGNFKRNIHDIEQGDNEDSQDSNQSDFEKKILKNLKILKFSKIQKKIQISNKKICFKNVIFFFTKKLKCQKMPKKTHAKKHRFFQY